MTDEPSTDLVFEIRNLGVAYDSKVIHSQVNWRLHRGAVHLLYGAAGSGKSTLLKALAGWQQRIPSMRVWGSAKLKGDFRLRDRPHLVHQSLGAFVSSVGANLAAALPDRGSMTQPEQRAHIQGLLQRCGMSNIVELWTESVSTLSAYKRRCLCLAQAIISEHQVIMLDEPAAGLPDTETDQLAETIQLASLGRIVVVATHDLRDATRYSPVKIATLSMRNVSTPAEALVIDGEQRHRSPVAPLSIRRVAPSGFHWVFNKTIAGLARPGLLNDLGEDLELLRRLGISALVCLEENVVYADAATSAGIEVLHFPIPDMHAPDELSATCELLVKMEALVDAGQRIGVHCKAGLGRTGTILACLAAQRTRVDAATALQTVRSVNPRFVQSTEQVEFIERFAAAVMGESRRY